MSVADKLARADQVTYGHEDFERWCKALKRELLHYQIGGGQVLSNLELGSCWTRGLSINQALNISSDIANGWDFDSAYGANT